MSLFKALVVAPVLIGLLSGQARAERSNAPIPALSIQTSGEDHALINSASRSGAAESVFEPFHLLPGGSQAYAPRVAVLMRQIADDRVMLALCRLGFVGCPAAARRFGAVIEQARETQGRTQLGLVNRSVNLAIAYTSDEVQHGQADVWSSPLATFESGRGDCEDYAIAKYVALLELGVKPADLRLVVVRRGPSGEAHAILAARLDQRWLILDNRTSLLVADGDLARYAALASFRLDLSRMAQPG